MFDFHDPISMMALTNISLAATGAISCFKSLFINTPRNKLLLVLGLIICSVYIGLDLAWIANDMASVVGAVNEWTWRLWEAAVSVFCTFVAMEYSRCRSAGSQCSYGRLDK